MLTLGSRQKHVSSTQTMRNRPISKVRGNALSQLRCLTVHIDQALWSFRGVLSSILVMVSMDWRFCSAATLIYIVIVIQYSAFTQSASRQWTKCALSVISRMW